MTVAVSQARVPLSCVSSVARTPPVLLSMLPRATLQASWSLHISAMSSVFNTLNASDTELGGDFNPWVFMKERKLVAVARESASVCSTLVSRCHPCLQWPCDRALCAVRSLSH